LVTWQQFLRYGAGRAVFSAGQEGMGQGRKFNTTYVTFFTKYEKDVAKIISFNIFIDKFASIKARKVPLLYCIKYILNHLTKL
jgi:hypothetical protein